MINLTNLKRLLAEMTPGKWTADGKYGSIHANHDDCGISSMGRRADAIGIVALVNAAPVLVEIAEAALDWQMLPQEPARLARKRILAALAKVTR
jgi:hypothetical protein